jgi:hypothetical protein
MNVIIHEINFITILQSEIYVSVVIGISVGCGLSQLLRIHKKMRCAPRFCAFE